MFWALKTQWNIYLGGLGYKQHIGISIRRCGRVSWDLKNTVESLTGSAWAIENTLDSLSGHGEVRFGL